LEIAKIGTVIILGEIYRMYVNKGGIVSILSTGSTGV
jgi:hypothetical protein